MATPAQDFIKKKVTDFINGKVAYDKYGGQYFWIADPNGGSQMLAEMRGWGHIQNMFRSGENIDQRAAGKFQDEVGDFIAAAINEKIEREKEGKASLDEIIDYSVERAFPDTEADGIVFCGKCGKQK